MIRMKNITKNFFSLLAIMAILVAANSCKDEEIPMVQVNNQDVTAAYPGDDVTIEGTNFNTVQFVFVGNRQATFQLDGDVITYQVPDASTPGLNTVTLAMVDNYRVTTELEVLVRPVPVIHTITPSAAAVGETVTIEGVSLNNLESVTVADVEATVDASASTAEKLVFTVPSGVANNTMAPIKIVTTGGETVSESTFYAGSNLLLNGTLEEGEGDEFTNWGKWNGGEGMTATTNATEAYSGRGIRVEAAGGDAWRTQFVSDPAATVVGVEYTAIAWVKGAQGTTGVGGSIRYSTNANAGALYGPDATITADWQQVSWTFTANDPATRLVLDMGVTDGAVYFVDNITLVATGIAGPTNELTNGGFEDGLTGWEVLNGAIEVTNAEANGGSNSVQVSPAGGNPWDTQMASDGMELIFGATYEVTLWAKGAGPGGIMRVSASQYDGNGADYFYGADVNVTEEWAEYSWTFEVGQDLETHRLVLDMGVGSQVIYVDDISLKEVVETQPQNLIANGSFEDELTDWEILNGTIELSTADAQDGANSVFVTPAAGNPWDTQMAATGIPLTFEGTYEVRLWAKATAAGGIMRVSASQYDGNGADYFYGDDVNLTEEWAEYVWTFEVGQDLETHRLVIDMGVGAVPFYLDNITLTEVQ